MGKRTTKTTVTETSTSNDSTSNSTLNMSGWSRLDEKEQLGHLNDRLAGYINRVRSLENENKRLNMHLKETEILENRDRKALEDAYLREIADLRKSLDDEASESARLKIDNDSLRAQFNEINDKLKRLQPLYDRAEAQLDSQRNLVNSLSGRNKTLEEENRRLNDEVKKLKKERDDAINEKNVAKKQLEEETLIRSQAENRVLSLREELRFERERHKQTVNEMKEKRETEISLTTRDLEEHYESKLAEQLRQVRAEFENSFAGRSKSDRDAMRDLTNQLHKANSERAQFESELTTMRHQLARAQDNLDNLRADYESRVRSAQDEAARLRGEIDQLTGDYNDLLEIKVKLDMEIAAYRMLLEEEETRLHLSPGEMKSSSATASAKRAANTSKIIEGITTVAAQESAASTPGGARHGVKRRRVQIQDIADEINARGGLRSADFQREMKRYHEKEYSALSGVKIEHDHQKGHWVKVHNNSGEDLQLGGWQLSLNANGHITKFTFSSRQKLSDGSTLTVYSSNAPDGVHKPAENKLQLKSQAWRTGTNMRTGLTNNDDEEIAWYVTDTNVDGMFEEGEEGDQRCAIM